MRRYMDRKPPGSVDILERLVAFETVSRTPNIALIDYVRDLLDDAGAHTSLVMAPDDRNANLYATVGPDGPGGVLLSGHTDVVPTDGQDWTVEPFQLTRSADRLYGRGTADMKGFVACAVRAIATAARRPLTVPLHLALSYDEEIGCIGVRSLIEMLKASPARPSFCIVGEPTELSVATGHKGKIAARATCTGKSVHSALAPQGINALHLGAEFVVALKRVQADVAETGVTDGDYDVPYSTIHAGVMQGGTALNIVANACTVDFEIRHLKDDDPSELLTRIKTVAGEIADAYAPDGGIHIDVLNRYPGLDTPPGADVVAFVKSLTGGNSTVKVAFGTEGGLFDSELGVPSVVCGPGSMAQGHKPDEFITVAQIEKCDRMLETLVDRLCATPAVL